MSKFTFSFGSLVLVAVIVGVMPSTALALKFSNQFIEFELPNTSWSCALEGAEWVCQSTDDQKKRDAIIVLAAKLKGDQDSLDKYQDYLTKPRHILAPGGTQLTSNPKYVKMAKINEHLWVDSLHLEAEVPGFYTRYLATVEQDIGVLVTYSVSKSKYQDYLGGFDGLVTSLKVFRKPGGVNTNAAESIFQRSKLPGTFTGPAVFSERPDHATPAGSVKTAKASKDGGTLSLLLLIGAGFVGYLWWRRRRG